MALEQLLREVCKRGLTHLSLSAETSMDGKKTYWRVLATPSTMNKYVTASGEDPIEAMEQVLKAVSKAPLRAAPSKTITAPVTTDEEPPTDFFRV